MHLVPERAHAGIREMTQKLADRVDAVSAAAPRVNIPAFGNGLASQAAEVAALFAGIQDNRISHLRRLSDGIAAAEKGVLLVERAEDESTAEFSGGAS
ncbi:hypothetical protein [Corynebacterium nuruki]